MTDRRFRFFGKLVKENKRGNVLMIFAFALLPLTFATGMTVDYSRAARLKTKLNVTADAAALAAVTQPMMQRTNAEAQTAAENMFKSQITGQPGLVWNDANLTVTVTGNNAVTASRTAVVTYTAQSTNSFGGVLGLSTITIGGTATASATSAPNIDFYMLLDTSPSMLLPATSAGLLTLTSKTGGCAFACHQTNLTGEVVCNKGVCKDYYTVARDNALQLRTDLLSEAVKNLTDVASATAVTNATSYRMGLASFDWRYQQLWPTLPVSGYNVDSNLATVKSHVSDAQVVTYCQNNYRVCGVNDNDQSTNFTSAFAGALATMPALGGNGTSQASDTPQAILFLITDGMRDEANGGRKLGPLPTAQCDMIKARNIRIAVLYTEYLPQSASDTWSVTNVKTPYLSPTDRISPALLSCASPGLYYKVTTDDDISNALTELFKRAVSTARLTQ